MRVELSVGHYSVALRAQTQTVVARLTRQRSPALASALVSAHEHQNWLNPLKVWSTNGLPIPLLQTLLVANFGLTCDRNKKSES